MKRILVFCIFTLSLISVCSAQNNQDESITITTYYPSPAGVFKNLRLFPSQEPDLSSPASQGGTLFYNESDRKPYVFNDNSKRWERIGSDDEAAVYLFKISPYRCSGQLSQAPFQDQLCSEPWHLNITFAQPFSKAPHVMVFLERPSDWINSSCASNTSDQYIAYPDLIDEKGFRLIAAGSPYNNDPSEPLGYCKNAVRNYENWYTRAAVSCLVIGE